MGEGLPVVKMYDWSFVGLLVLISVLIFIYAGEPDLHDLLIQRLMGCV
jgi:hypothetical protein